ncbi:putative major pilin subunit [Variovorax sp. PBL-H6]|uniref:GspH/FimT family pseudopilin n=1 Tax=Variovorax sp. PBL-H6 TaxID=434009 RepID=UPI001319B4F6|nr:GspH/FimT family pseudopilin [Variovorax sp. PBL-H6]VTU28968.1 putative major pilin subunit [Variovorax sp. PBL-H6]
MKSRLSRVACKGFTLIELMVTLAVAAILMVIAAPGFLSFQRNSELTSAVNGLVASIAAARGEAMKSGRYAMVVPSDATHWSSGWVVFVDRDADNGFTESADSAVLRQPALPSYFSVEANGNAKEGQTDPPYIRFDPSGYPKTKGGGFGPLTISITRNDLGTSAALDQTRRVIISPSGRVRSCRPSSATDAKCSPPPANPDADD